MPFINVKTNSELVNTCKEQLKAELGRAITAIPGKSEAWLMISISDPCDMWFKGSNEDCAMFEVSVYGSASDSAYDDLTQRLCALSEKYLGVSASRTYVKYVETEHWGWNNMNF
jgi:phenylpyruvate tautomerase PptA (4-oxalocrotonate tautomerase family)